MLVYIDSSDGTNVIDDISYTESPVNVQQIKEAFHIIFKSMNQEQHYNHMMGI